MNLVDRVKNIILTPKTEWPVIAAESTSVRDLYLGYVMLLAAIGPVAQFIGISIFGLSLPFGGRFTMPIVWALSQAITHYILTLVGVFVIALIIEALAPTFAGTKNRLQALKVTAYALTPSWIAGVLLLMPSLAILALLAALYGVYLLYLGLPVLMKSPPEKALPYTAVVIVCVIVLFVIVAAIAGLVGGFGMPSRGLPYHP
jgi:hypothetical protein